MKPGALLQDFKTKGYLAAWKNGFIWISIAVFVLGLIIGSDLLRLVYISIITSVVLSSIFFAFGYWHEEHYLAGKNDQRLNDPAFKFLIDLGFEKNDKFLEGMYGGYPMAAWWSLGDPFERSEMKMGYCVRLSFEFGENFRPRAELEEKHKEEEHILWVPQRVEAVLSCGNKKLPTSEQMKAKADRVVAIMRSLDLRPLE